MKEKTSNNIIIIILFTIIVMNYAFDLIINRLTTDTFENLIQTIRVHEQELYYINIYNNRMERIYYQMSHIAISTQLKCNVERYERLKETKKEIK